jgi:hypothetical protein
MKSDEAAVERYLQELLKKSKSVPTVVQLEQHCQKRQFRPRDRSVYARVLREYLPELARHKRKDRVSGYQTIGVLQSGVFFVDYTEFHKNWREHNDGCTGFLVAVENLTNRLFALPTRGRDTGQWLKSVAEIVEKTGNVRVIITDRDSVALSARFRNKIASTYGVRWFFLKKGHKSYLAERFVGFLKKKLGQALSLWGGKNWLGYLAEAVEAYNNERVPGTSYKRKNVIRKNFNRFASQLLKEPKLDTRFSSFKAGPFKNRDWNKRIFRFELGQKVLLARKADWSKKPYRFVKISELGGFGPSVYTVSGRQLRANKRFDRYIPVYSLKELGPSLHFYERELAWVK